MPAAAIRLRCDVAHDRLHPGHAVHLGEHKTRVGIEEVMQHLRAGDDIHAVVGEGQRARHRRTGEATCRSPWFAAASDGVASRPTVVERSCRGRAAAAAVRGRDVAGIRSRRPAAWRAGADGPRLSPGPSSTARVPPKKPVGERDVTQRPPGEPGIGAR